jgi:hypothetical protein
MTKTIELTPGDPCPGCGGTLRKAVQPTPEERARAIHKEEPQPLPPHYDTAPLDVVQELGELWRCPECGYPARFKPEPTAETDAAGVTAAEAALVTAKEKVAARGAPARAGK